MARRLLVIFSAYGLLIGLISAWWWLLGACSIPPSNLPGVLLGDWLYDASIRWLGDPSSPHAHYTIPAPLRIPWVYVPSSLLAWSAVGAVVQAIADVLASRGLSSELRRLEQVVTCGLALATAATAALALLASLPWGP